MSLICIIELRKLQFFCSHKSAKLKNVGKHFSFVKHQASFCKSFLNKMLHTVCFSLSILLAFNFLTVNTAHFNFTRQKRYLPLIFQNPAAITYITGFGIPVHNLNPELVTVGMVFKAQQFLPTTYSALRHQANHSIHKREAEKQPNESNAAGGFSRSLFYKALEQLSISLGQEGRSCVSKMICDVASTPFHYENGVLGDIMHILLTPSSSEDTNLDNSYKQAEHNGRNSVKCDEYYTKCISSILAEITNLFE